MKKIIYPILLVTIVITVSCTSSRGLSQSRAEKRAAQEAAVDKALASERYIINIDRLYALRGSMVLTDPKFNYIAISNNKARLNLGYLGNSWGVNKIAGIDFSGEIIEKTVERGKNNSVDINMKVKKNSDIFSIKMNIGRNGICNVYVAHPKIDFTNYRGQLARL